MLPLEEFDSADVMRERFTLLCGAGAPPGRFHGIAPPPIIEGVSVPGKSGPTRQIKRQRTC